MIHFISEDKFNISGRGTVFSTTCPLDIQYKQVFKQEIMVDGVKFYCRGIERFGKFLGNEIIGQGERVGLLVSEIV